MTLLRAIAFNLAFWGWTAAFGMLGLPVLLLPRRAAMAFGRFWSRGTVLLLRCIVGCDYEVRGREFLPSVSAIIAMKHQSAWDAIILPIVLDNPAAVVKRELLWLPVYGWYLGRAGAISIDRRAGGAALRRMVAAAKPAVAAGRPIVIFPQGTRVASKVRLPYQPGVAALYQALALPVVPVAVNSGLFWGRRAFLKRPGRIVVEFLDPIPPGLPRRRLMSELEDRIETATAALEEEPGAAALPAPSAGRLRAVEIGRPGGVQRL